MRNKYIYRSRISDHKFRLILRFFSYDIEAKTTSQFLQVLVVPLSIKYLSKSISIPSVGNAESLNVGVTAGIIANHLRAVVNG